MALMVISDRCKKHKNNQNGINTEHLDVVLNLDTFDKDRLTIQICSDALID